MKVRTLTVAAILMLHHYAYIVVCRLILVV